MKDKWDFFNKFDRDTCMRMAKEEIPLEYPYNFIDPISWYLEMGFSRESAIEYRMGHIQRGK